MLIANCELFAISVCQFSMVLGLALRANRGTVFNVWRVFDCYGSHFVVTFNQIIRKITKLIWSDLFTCIIRKISYFTFSLEWCQPFLPLLFFLLSFFIFCFIIVLFLNIHPFYYKKRRKRKLKLSDECERCLSPANLYPKQRQIDSCALFVLCLAPLAIGMCDVRELIWGRSFFFLTQFSANRFLFLLFGGSSSAYYCVGLTRTRKTSNI